MSHDLIVFDLDGTLVDSEPVANRVFYEKLMAAGLDPAIDEARVTRDFTGLSLESCFAVAREQYGLALPPGFRDDLQDETYRRLQRDLQPIPGAEALLSRLTGPRCVASSSEAKKIVFSLERTGLARFFAPEALFSAQQVARGKPEPDLFLFAAQRMAADPNRCLVVEDSLPGATAGIRAGMQVFAYRPAADAAQDAPFKALGCRIIRRLDELQAIVY